MKAIAIIPARGGSKRIPRKNIRSFVGHPIISYPIAAARTAGCFTEVMVSTDDYEIAEIAQRLGASVPFLRSAATAGDNATTADALLEVIASYAQAGQTFDAVCCLYPTAALVRAERIKEGYQTLQQRPDAATVVSVQRFGHPIQRAFQMLDGALSMIQPQHVSTRSQDLVPTYHDAGQWYWFRPENFMQSRSLFAAPCIPVILSELEAQDIDNDSDWRLAEAKFQLNQELTWARC